MKSICAYSSLIKEIPVGNQSTKIKRETWKKLLYNLKNLEEELFKHNDEIELSTLI